MSSDFSDGAQLEHLSTQARHVLRIDADRAYSTLVPAKAGSPEARDAIELIRPRDIVATPAVDQQEANAALSGLWLWHDFLHESHTLSQAIHTPSGSYWHAIMHRREGDFSNAKYWYRRCVDHPAARSITGRVNELIQTMPVDKSLFRLTANGWDPMAFVDLIEAVHATPVDPRHGLAVIIGKMEWQALFETCIRAAAGR